MSATDFVVWNLPLESRNGFRGESGVMIVSDGVEKREPPLYGLRKILCLGLIACQYAQSLSILQW